ncbi:hypothetical protein DUNSADRAFT_4731 [Dunaliella salina]|uniref:Uncharacterized protein n=1 Tax=Dunaliella salina TaxID=3046 RepID=A0ABQ7GRD7_DUNSA|nr:hypothetical protein DUNSADRAFT_4731 [Dunaliella salina]|eukprot:KAF5837171.1 hypothetical protein DUNSADRAFT_4731 [Dunaliella salina]
MQLQAKLQAATGMGSLGALPAQLMQQQQRMGGLGPGMMPGMTDPAAAETHPHTHMHACTHWHARTCMQLQAKLQAATGMGSLGALPAQLMQQQQRMGGLGPGMMPGMTDPAAAEHLMHQLMQQQQHQSHHQQPQQQTEVMQIMAGALPSQPQQHQQQQQQAATAAASAAMAAAAHGQQAGHTPAAVAAAAAHMQMLQNGGLPALPGSMEAQQQQQQQQQLAGTTAGSLSAGVMGVHGGVLAQQQHAATLAGVGGLRGVVRNPNGMVPSLEGGATGPGAFLHGPLNMHNVGGGGRRGSNSSSGRPGVSTSAPQLHHAPAFGMGLPHDQQHTAPDALLAQQFAGLGVNGGLGGMVPFPHFALAPSHSNIGMASSLYSSSSGFAGTAAAATHGAFGGGPTFRRQRSLPPPHAVRVPIAQGAGRSTSLQQPAHLRTQQQQQQQQHGGGDTSLAAHSLPPQALRRGSSGKHSSMLDPGSGSLVPSNSMMAIPSAAVLQSAGSAPTQMPRPRSREAAAGLFMAWL